MDNIRLSLEAVRCEFGGIGIHPDFIHVDVRREPFRALWGRRADGRYASAAEAIAELLERERG